MSDVSNIIKNKKVILGGHCPPLVHSEQELLINKKQ
jgi:hypothetical protein